jgi:hypothetical protein
MQFGVVQLEKWARTQPVIAFSTLEFHFSVFGFIFSWLVDEASLVLWCKVELPFPLSVLGPFLNCCCDNFEQHEVRMIKLLRIVSPRK